MATNGAASARENGQKKPWILYSSEDEKVVLIDVPGSIARWTCPGKCLLSTAPPNTPYLLPEPKSERGKAAVPAGFFEFHNEVLEDINYALKDTHHELNGLRWCLPRKVSEMREESAMLTAELMENLRLLFSFAPTSTLDEYFLLPLGDSDGENIECLDISDVFNRVVCNKSNTPTRIHINILGSQHGFTIPAKSSFLLSEVQSSLRAFSKYSKSIELFDFILMDPPWPNRSALRCQHSYDTIPSVAKLLNLSLGRHIRSNGLVAVWITNKPKWRKFVLEKMFPKWGLSFAGRWIWVKVTSLGEPIFDLESLNRKPYEILLFGAKKQRGMEVRHIPSKVVVGVPDLHSRKPCLKDLIEPHIPENYKACEIFGRYLVDGWLTWGNEAIRHNSEEHWR